ncbi:uncharacterized protein LOC143300714 [Babylonia areolata]|uniref:uncharacterized protein LOC143300714 n=1 Tax=Babylonia areolata TaxID=304850 RepID=UPI003FD03C77
MLLLLLLMKENRTKTVVSMCPTIALYSLAIGVLAMPAAVVLATVSTCRSTQVTSLRDSMMSSSWMISQSAGVNGSVRCGLLCLREARCVSFLYSDVMHDCRLFAVVMAASDVTSPAVGYRYYDTCKAAGYYGSGCGADSQCTIPNTRCVQARCRCQEGYSFDASANACVAHCASYGPEFEYIPGWYIDQYSQQFFLNVNTEDCLDLCRQATSYVCRSAEVRLNLDPACATATVTKLDVPSSAWRTSNIWVMVYYQRHCSL